MIKPAFEALNSTNLNSFLIRTFNESSFSAPYHFHPEFELTLILKGEGKRYIGSNMSAYEAGDLVMIGSNLPHCWKSENINKGELNASSLVIQFKDDFLGTDFLLRPEMASVLQLFNRSSFGIQFLNKTALQVKEALLLLAREEGPFRKLILFLQILHELSSSKEYILLDKKQSNFSHSSAERERINAVLAYIVDNFREDITLDEASAIAQMTTTAFCRYFKKITRKTFIETVTEYRLNYATQQLIQTDKSVSDICYESGFGDVSHFYKTFKQKKKFSPLHYRKRFMKEIYEE